MLFTINKYMLLFLCLFIKENVKQTFLKKQLNFF